MKEKAPLSELAPYISKSMEPVILGPNITGSVQFSPYDAQNARRPIIFSATGAMTLSDATATAESIEKQVSRTAKRYQLKDIS